MQQKIMRLHERQIKNSLKIKEIYHKMFLLQKKTNTKIHGLSLTRDRSMMISDELHHEIK